LSKKQKIDWLLIEYWTMESGNEYYRKRSQKMALEVIGLFSGKYPHPAYWVIAKQAIRPASSTAANYRAMCLGRSQAERYSTLCIVVEEADETAFWLELLASSI
jgi:four helix bundle protein